MGKDILIKSDLGVNYGVKKVATRGRNHLIDRRILYSIASKHEQVHKLLASLVPGSREIGSATAYKVCTKS
jgi:hypothetical protein